MMEDDDDLRWEDVGAVADWPDGSAHRVQIGARRIGVYRVGADWYALKDVCPHAGVSLCSGSTQAGCLSEPVVTCPAHGWQFDLRSGRQVGSVLLGGSRCATYPVKVVDGRVLVGV